MDDEKLIRLALLDADIEPHVRRPSLFGGYRQITAREFNAAWRKVLRELTELGKGA